MPRSDDALVLSPPAEHDGHHPSCPPDETGTEQNDRVDIIRSDETEPVRSESSIASPPTGYSGATPHQEQQQPTPPADGIASPCPEHGESPHPKHMEVDIDDPTRDSPSPTSCVEEPSEQEQRAVASPAPISNTSPTELWQLASVFPSNRFLPNSTSSFLRPGSRFQGTQQSDLQVYDVNVELKHVDMNESFLCGYLRIQGLTDVHPTLTTYFEGEIIGTKHTFITKHPEWGSNEKVDMQHWARFPSWRPLAKAAKRSDFSFKNFASREHIFMRWKEYFLVPDHTVRSLNGASYEGFYYICFNQITGSVSGIYFHAKSEKYQQLELSHVEDHGCVGAIEFR